MKKPTYPVKIVKSDEDLLSDDAADMHGDTLVVVALNHLEQVDTHDLEHHTEVIPIWALVDKRIKELDDMTIVSGKVSSSFLVKLT